MTKVLERGFTFQTELPTFFSTNWRISFHVVIMFLKTFCHKFTISNFSWTNSSQGDKILIIMTNLHTNHVLPIYPVPLILFYLSKILEVLIGCNKHFALRELLVILNFLPVSNFFCSIFRLPCEWISATSIFLSILVLVCCNHPTDCETNQT